MQSQVTDIKSADTINRSDTQNKTASKPKTFTSTFYHHRALNSWELWLDDVKFKWREMRQPLNSWRARHFFALYCLSRFVLKPVMYFPGILSFYCVQPGRRFHKFWKWAPVKLPKLMAEPFWKSGSEQGFMRTPFGGQRWKEACGDWAVFLSLTWPVWLWTRLYYAYFIIEYCRWKVTMEPSLTPKDALFGNIRLGQPSSSLEIQRQDALRPSVPIDKL